MASTTVTVVARGCEDAPDAWRGIDHAFQKMSTAGWFLAFLLLAVCKCVEISRMQLLDPKFDGYWVIDPPAVQQMLVHLLGVVPLAINVAVLAIPPGRRWRIVLPNPWFTVHLDSTGPALRFDLTVDCWL